MKARIAAALPVHPACARFPKMPDAEIDGLAKSIKEDGQTDPAVISDGVLLDGRHRIAACFKLGIDVDVVEFDGEPGTEVAWILAKNFRRRHLNTGQKAMIAASFLPGFQAKAKVRQARKAPDEPKRKASEDAGAALGISSRSVEQATKILRQGTPEIVEAVKDKGLPLSIAVMMVADMSLEEQQEIARALPPKVTVAESRKIQKAVAAVRKKRKAEANAERVEAAKATAPAIPGVEIRCCTNAELLATLPDGALAFAMADPNWQYRNKQNGAASKHYDGSEYDAIIADMDAIYDKCAEDCYMLMWCTFPIEREWHIATHLAGDGFRWEHIGGGGWGKRVSDDELMGSGYHQRGDAELYLLYKKGNPRPFNSYHSNWHASTRTAHSEKPVRWLREALKAWCPEGGLAGEFWGGLAPLARACMLEGRRCVTAEMDPARHGEASAALVERLNEEPIEWVEDNGEWTADVHGITHALSEDSEGWVMHVRLGTNLIATRRPRIVNIISAPQAQVWAVHVIATARAKGWE